MKLHQKFKINFPNLKKKVGKRNGKKTIAPTPQINKDNALYTRTISDFIYRIKFTLYPRLLQNSKFTTCIYSTMYMLMTFFELFTRNFAGQRKKYLECILYASMTTSTFTWYNNLLKIWFICLPIQLKLYVWTYIRHR